MVEGSGNCWWRQFAGLRWRQVAPSLMLLIQAHPLFNSQADKSSLNLPWVAAWAYLDTVLEFVRHPLTPTLSPNGGEGEEALRASSKNSDEMHPHWQARQVFS
jgi:hypothetical protein